MHGRQQLTVESSSQRVAMPVVNMPVVNRLLWVIAQMMAVGGSVALYIYAQDSLRSQSMSMSSQRACLCQGTGPGPAGFSPVRCPVLKEPK